jgi:hypothetical protein
MSVLDPCRGSGQGSRPNWPFSHLTRHRNGVATSFAPIPRQIDDGIQPRRALLAFRMTLRESPSLRGRSKNPSPTQPSTCACSCAALWSNRPSGRKCQREARTQSSVALRRLTLDRYAAEGAISLQCRLFSSFTHPNGVSSRVMAAGRGRSTMDWSPRGARAQRRCGCVYLMPLWLKARIVAQ